MGATTWTDLQIYEDQFYSGMYERLMQNLNVFDAASNGALTIVPNYPTHGYHTQEAFFKTISSSAVQSRDPAAQTDITATALQTGEEAGVRVFRTIYHHIPKTVMKEAQIGSSPEEFMRKFGWTLSEAMRKDYLSLAASALVGAFKASSMSSAVYDARSVGTGVITPAAINQGMKLFGDQQQNLVALLGRGFHKNNLIAGQIIDKFPDLGIQTIFAGQAGTLGLPFIGTDEPALSDSGSSSLSTDNQDWLFLLKPSAIEIKEVADTMELALVKRTGKTNIAWDIQLEWDVVIKIPGMKFNLAVDKPTNANLATGANWSLVGSTIKHGPGVGIKVNQE